MNISFNTTLGSNPFLNGNNASNSLSTASEDGLLAQSNGTSAKGAESEYSKKSDVTNWADPNYRNDRADVSDEAREPETDDSLMKPVVDLSWGISNGANEASENAQKDADFENMRNWNPARRR